jgi:hypothetical protein
MEGKYSIELFSERDADLEAVLARHDNFKFACALYRVAVKNHKGRYLNVGVKLDDLVTRLVDHFRKSATKEPVQIRTISYQKERNATSTAYTTRRNRAIAAP